MHAGNTFLYDALDLLEHVGVFFIDPVSQVTTVIQDLMGNQETDEQSGRERGKRLRGGKNKVKVKETHGERTGSFPIQSRVFS